MKNAMGVELIPKDDDKRVKALRRYNILDTPPEGAFNKIAEIALASFQVPICCITFVDKDRVFYKQGYCDAEGKNMNLGRTGSTCSLAILNNDVSLVEHMDEDPCMMLSTEVIKNSSYRFYAGAPLRTLDGYNIGMFVVVDTKPRIYSEDEKEILGQFAQIVMDELELRFTGRKIIRFQNTLLGITTHEAKSPLNRVLGLLKLLRVEKNTACIAHIINLIEEASKNMLKMIDTVSETNILELGQLYLNLSSVNLSALLQDVIKNNEIFLNHKNQQIQLDIEHEICSVVDRDRMIEVFDALLVHAVRRSPPYSKINIKLFNTAQNIRFEIKDCGEQLSGEQINQLFEKLVYTGFKRSQEELSTGLELPLVKNLVTLHNGNVWAENNENEQGCKMIVELSERSN